MTKPGKALKEGGDTNSVRLVPVGRDRTTKSEFCDNTIKTSKYNIFSFWILNPLEQFRRIANLYFLLVIIILRALPDPPIPFYTCLIPLIFVIGTTMIKQGYEDFKRHMADRSMNGKTVDLLKEGKIVKIKSQDIRVGDIVRVNKDEMFPADLVLISTSNPDGKCFVLTSNLDGETNLKLKSASKVTRTCDTMGLLGNLQAEIECESPTTDLLSFKGQLVRRRNSREAHQSLGQENLVLRGTKLSNTDFLYGCAVYTGKETKMSLNSKLSPNKFSSAEKSTNIAIIAYVGIIMAEMIVNTSLRYGHGFEFQYDSFPVNTTITDHWYLGYYLPREAKHVFYDVFSFMVIFNNIVPISLYVTLEVQKFVGSKFLAWDRDLYDSETDEPAKVNCSDLCEELGLIEILFTDKTGTLTENVMLFKNASINGVKYDSEALTVSPATTEEIDEPEIAEFLTALCVCHTVQVAGSEEDQEIRYTAASADEKAIIEACAGLGVKFIGEKEREDSTMTRLSFSRAGQEEIKEYQKLMEFSFDSERARMSVIARDPSGKIMLITKGAECSVLPRCISGPVAVTSLHIDEWAGQGLRTLAVAARELSEAELERIEEKLSAAKRVLTERERKVQEVYDEVERDLSLLGATAVEDKLQEGVKETLVNLGLAGITVWMITGDKKETATNISHSCGHFTPDLTILDMTEQTEESVGPGLEDCLGQIDLGNSRTGLILDGTSLALILPLPDLKELLYQTASRCRAVVCCRMSPLQKSEIVKMMKNSPMKPITAAVGDGGNDVSMIQEAHVGLGIMGKEGRAAVRAADFAFAKFRFLQKILLVHGHWFYNRMTVLVHYFFYKNIACFAGVFFYQFFSDYSKDKLYDTLNIMLFNMSWTSLPIFLFGLLEQNIPAAVLLNNPQLYRNNTRNNRMSFGEFLLWFLQGLWHSVTVFFGWYLFFDFGLNLTSVDCLGKFAFGFCNYTTLITVINLKLLLESRFWNLPLVSSVILSILVYIIFNIITAYLWVNTSLHNAVERMTYVKQATFLKDGVKFNTSQIHTFPINMELLRVFPEVLSSLGVWLFNFLIIVVAFIPDVISIILRNLLVKTDYNKSKSTVGV